MTLLVRYAEVVALCEQAAAALRDGGVVVAGEVSAWMKGVRAISAIADRALDEAEIEPGGTIAPWPGETGATAERPRTDVIGGAQR